MSIVKKIKKTGKKIRKTGKKTAEVAAMVALAPVAIVGAVIKAKKDD